ncbi:MAG: glycosyltransferase family 2 protein [Dehalococcoidia bacterium]
MTPDGVKPTISIIIPTFNRSHVLARAIKSALLQTYQDFEIIVVDDCSSDSTSVIVGGLNDGRISYIRHEKNRGVAAARNSGLAASKGEYVAFLDSDDEWLPEKLERELKCFREATADTGIVYTGVFLAKEKIVVRDPPPNFIKKMCAEHLEPIYLWLQASLIKRECFRQVGVFDEQLKSAEDLDMRIRIMGRYGLKYINAPLAIIHDTQGSLSGNTYSLAQMTLKVFNKNLNFIQKYPGLHAAMLHRIGYLFVSAGRTGEGRTYLFKAARLHPTDIRYLAEAVASLGGYHFFRAIESGYQIIRDWQSSRAK